MDKEIAQRMQAINNMLLDMASGNFSYRIERSPSNDNIEALVVTLNMLAEEIQDKIIHQGYTNSNNAVLDIVQMSFLLDGGGNIQMVNQQSCAILSTLCSDIIGRNFETLLTSTSARAWQAAWKKIKTKEMIDVALPLTFKTKASLVLPKMAYVTGFAQKKSTLSKTLITIVHHSSVQNELDAEIKKQIKDSQAMEKPRNKRVSVTVQKPKIRLSYEDIRKIRAGHDMIINNLEMEFPSLREFALLIGTNEFKLKYGFKELYGTTVYSFITHERLKKARMMIQFSDLPLKSIAYMTGFKSMPHFSRTFKKRYQYAPSELRKNTIDELETDL